MKINSFNAKLFTLFLLIQIFFFSNGCQNNADIYETLTFSLPKFNISDFTLIKWKIEIQSQNYSDKYFISADTEYIKISVPKNQPLSITAAPLTESAETLQKNYFFKPAGTIYPFDFNESVIPLTWENGFSAYLMQQLFKSDENNPNTSKIIHSFNWKKLNDSIRSKIQESINEITDSNFSSAASASAIFFNPWLTDYEKIMDNLSISKFSINLLSQKNCICINPQNYQLTSESDKIYSSFIPENKIIHQFSQITISTTKENIFTNKIHWLIIKASSSKKVSTQIVFMPILIETYEKQKN